jgi:tricorn protease-like protein
MSLSTSPDGQTLLYMRNGKLWAYDLETNQETHLDKDLDIKFSDEEDDTLAVEKRPYGQGILAQGFLRLPDL